MKTSARDGALGLLISAAAPVCPGWVVWNSAAPAVDEHNRNLPVPKAPSSPFSATATEHQRDVDGALLIVCSNSFRNPAPPSANFVGLLTTLRSPTALGVPKWQSKSRSLV